MDRAFHKHVESHTAPSQDSSGRPWLLPRCELGRCHGKTLRVNKLRRYYVGANVLRSFDLTPSPFLGFYLPPRLEQREAFDRGNVSLAQIHGSTRELPMAGARIPVRRKSVRLNPLVRIAKYDVRESTIKAVISPAKRQAS